MTPEREAELRELALDGCDDLTSNELLAIFAALDEARRERDEARQELCSLLSGHLSPSDAVRLDAITRATAARRGWGM